jgi:hypothetical protein
MKIEFADSFWKSLRTMSRHQTWWYKTYEFFRRDLPYFIENIWFFRKELWAFRSWDYNFNLQMFRRSLEKTAHTLEFYGNEVEESRMKKVQKIKRLVELINNLNETSYISRAEEQLGELKNSDSLWSGKEDSPEDMEHNRKVFELSDKIEKDEWKELCSIIEGQDYEEFRKLYDNMTPEEKSDDDQWYKWFDGSGLKNWWD